MLLWPMQIHSSKYTVLGIAAAQMVHNSHWNMSRRLHQQPARLIAWRYLSANTSATQIHGEIVYTAQNVISLRAEIVPFTHHGNVVVIGFLIIVKI
jgi:hypothetical protein